MTPLSRSLIYYPLMFIAFSSISMLAAFYPIWISSFTHVAFPILAMLIFGMLTRFGYVKMNTLILGRVLVILAAFGWGDHIILSVTLILLQVNILEAGLIDLYKKHYFNAIGGILLLGSSFFLALSWTGSCVRVENESYLLWIAAYTLWNASFVTLHLKGASFAHHFLFLLSPIVSCLVIYDFSYWLMFRETSLLLGIAMLATFKKELRLMEHLPPFAGWFATIYAFVHRKHTQILLLSIVGICTFIQIVFL